MAYSSLSQYQNTQFPSDLTDVRGFEVRTRDDDDKVGRVHDLVCTADGQIRYLDVDLGGFFNPRHVVLPVGAAQVDRSNDVVWITGMSKAQIKDLPDYDGDASSLTGDYESNVRRSASSITSDDELYDHGRFYADRHGSAARDARLVLSEEQLAVGKRQVSAGTVGVRKTVETEHVRETVPLVREEVVVERHALSGEQANLAGRDLTIGEDEIRVDLTREEAVVDKRVVPVEEVVLRKQAVTEERVIDETVRRERAVVDEGTLGADRSRGLSGGLSGQVGSREAGMSGAADRAHDSGLLDRAADKLDDVKDRVDGNPASRPGPDATDRRI